MVDHKDELAEKETAAAEALHTGWQCAACGQQLADAVVACPRDGTRKLSVLAKDSHFRGYEFLAVIGSGGMGVIYKAQQTALKKTVAIKMLHPYLISDDAVRRFQIEGQAVNKLDHPNIIKVHIMGVSDSGPYLIMDYVEGRTLTEVVQSEGPLRVERTLSVFIQACDALAHAHSRGVLHRDLKPSNIMLRRNFRGEEEVCIMDFGIAKMLDDTADGASHGLTKTGEMLGSPLYMSPEQARGSAIIDVRSDIYSLGCVMFEALTGAPPFQGSTPLETMMKHIDAKPLGLSQSMLGTRKFDETIEATIERLLQKEPERRFQSMDELKRHLLAIQEGKQLNQLVYKPQSAKRPKLAAVAGVVVVLAALAIIFFVVNDLGNSDNRPSDSGKSASDNKTASAVVPEARAPQGSEIPLASSLLSARAYLTQAVTNQAKEIAPPFNELVPIADDDLIILRQARAVEVLSLKKSSEITSKGLENLVDLPKLKDVDVSWCPQIKSLAPFRRMKALRQLELCGNSNIGDKELNELRGLPLSSLDLSSTQVSILNVLKSMPALTELTLGRAPITREAMRNISTLKNLSLLDISGTDIKDADLQFLFGMRHLERISLADCNNLSAQGVESLQKNLPHTAIAVPQSGRRQQTGSPTDDQIRPLREKAMVLFERHQFDELAQTCTTAINRLRKDSHPNYGYLVFFERNLAFAKAFCDKPHYAEALDEIDRAIFTIEGGDAQNDPKQKAQCYFIKASCLYGLGRVDEALVALKTSEGIDEQLNNEVPGDLETEMSMAAALKTMGTWHLKRGSSIYDLKQGTSELERAYATYQIDAPANAAICCYGLGDAYRDQAEMAAGKTEKARLYNKALKMYQEADDYNHSGKSIGMSPLEIATVRKNLESVKAELAKL